MAACSNVNDVAGWETAYWHGVTNFNDLIWIGKYRNRKESTTTEEQEMKPETGPEIKLATEME